MTDPTPEPAPSSDSSGPRTPPALMAAAIVVALQGIAVAAAVIVGVVAGVVGVAPDRNLAATAFITLAGLGVGVALVLVAVRGLLRCRAWARAPALVTQLVCVPVAVVMGQGGLAAAGIPLGVAALFAGAVLLSGATARAMYGDRAAGS